MLILQARYPGISLRNLSNSDDTRVLKQALQKREGTVDIHHAGTAMRFLTAYFASTPGADVVLTGSERMQQRPIGILVDALAQLGADISYGNKEGYPPLKIKGRLLEGSEVSLPGNVSSQYISALLLAAPGQKDGLTIRLSTPPTSVPYIEMTLSLLSQLGVTNQFDGQTISVPPKEEIAPVEIAVESDWSSASYFYSILALSPVGAELTLNTFRENSLQGDSRLAELYTDFGVDTTYGPDSILLRKTGGPVTAHLRYDLVDCPDLAQTIAGTCLGLGIGCTLTGLHTLKIKETDRLEALRAEISKFGAAIAVTDKSLELQACTNLSPGVAVATYNDHRMAMAMAPLALKTGLTICDADVVSKSYPDFWKDMASLGITVSST